MLSFKDFECPHMEQAANGVSWICSKRKSLFINIGLHCADCGLYAQMMKKMERELRKHGNIR